MTIISVVNSELFGREVCDVNLGKPGLWFIEGSLKFVGEHPSNPAKVALLRVEGRHGPWYPCSRSTYMVAPVEVSVRLSGTIDSALIQENCMSLCQDEHGNIWFHHTSTGFWLAKPAERIALQAGSFFNMVNGVKYFARAEFDINHSYEIVEDAE